MAIIITDECINCGACEPECPNTAIYEGGAEWKYSDGTSLTGMITTLDGNDLMADEATNQLIWMFISSLQINVQSVLVSMMNLNVLQYVL